MWSIFIGKHADLTIRIYNLGRTLILDIMFFFVSCEGLLGQ